MIQQTFPLGHFPSDVQDQIRRISAHDGVPEAMPACAALAGASMAIGRGFDFAMDEFSTPIPSNLWITPVAPSGAGKSSINNFCEVLQDLYDEQDLEWKMDRKPELRAELEKLEIEAVEAKKAKEWNNLKSIYKLIAEKTAQIRAGRPVWKVENFTVEALTSAFSAEGRVPYACIIAAEGRAVADNLLCSYADKSTESFWLAGWSRTDTVMRARKGFEDSDVDGTVKGLQIAAIFGLQPDKHEPFTKPPFSTSGFAQRRLFCMIEPNELMCRTKSKRLAEEAGIPRPDMSRWNTWVRAMLATAVVNNGQRCIPTDEALQVWEEFYDQINAALKAGKLSSLETHARRWGEISAKIALVLHCLKHGQQSAAHPIDKETMTGGVEIMRWFANEMKAGYWEVQNEARAGMLSKLEKFAGTRCQGGFTIRDLVRGGVGSRQDLETLVDVMEKRGDLIRLMQPPTQGMGRPKADRWMLSKFREQQAA